MSESLYQISGKCLSKSMKYVYLIRDGRGNYKVGLAKSVDVRVRELQTANADPLEIVAVKATEQPEALEAWLHDFLRDHRSGGGTEWFKLTDSQALEVVVLMYQEPSAYLQVRPSAPVRIDLTNQALEVFRSEGRVSTSLLQRRLGIGYPRAARTMESLINQKLVVVDEDTHLPRLVA